MDKLGFHEWIQKAVDNGIDGEDPFELSQAAWYHQEKRIRDLEEQSTKLSDLILALQENGEKLAAQSERLAEALEPFVQQYAHSSDEELENVSGKFIFERMKKARAALAEYRGK